MIPDTMVAALAHDLGKLESMRGYLYSLGEHPLFFIASSVSNS